MHLAGAFIDDIVVKSGGTTLLTDDVEQGDNGWTAAGGFRQSTGTEVSSGDRYYLAENRTYVGYDATLEKGPYQFSNALTKPDWVEHFAYQDGLLVWAIDETYSDNNTIEHQGHGLALPVDAGVTPMTYPDGTMPSNRRQPYDATFGLQAIDEVALHKEIVVGKGKSQTIESVAAVVGDGSAQAADRDVHGCREGRVLQPAEPARRRLRRGPRRVRDRDRPEHRRHHDGRRHEPDRCRSADLIRAS